MQLTVIDSTSKNEKVRVNDSLFTKKPANTLLAVAVRVYLSNLRQGTSYTKTRSEIKRTKKKWYKQKGTGNARHGARTPNIFVGGGQAHKPRPRSYAKQMPRKMRRLALRSALSAKVAAEEMIVLDELVFDQPATVQVMELLNNLEVAGSVVILLPERNENVEKSARNLQDVKTLRANYLNIRDLLGYDYVIMPKGAVSVIEGFLG